MLNHKYVNTPLSDLGVYHYGIENLPSGYTHGPAVWDCYLIHYIRNGKGTCTLDGKKYELHQNQGFLIQPGQMAFYAADEENPWSYAYIGFDGSKARTYLEQANITIESPVFTYRLNDSLSEIVRQMIRVENHILIRETAQTSLIYNFISKLIENSENIPMPSRASGERTDYYIELATTFLTKNYAQKVTIKDVAKHVGLNPSYLGSLFKQQFGVSPQEFLLDYRLERACELMHNPLLSIGDIARSVGYTDQLQFSKIFKKVKGLSPKLWRSKYV